MAAANTQVTGRRQGRQAGLIRSLASAAARCGVEFDGLMGIQRGWGLCDGAGPAREMEAMRALPIFLVSLLLLAWILGSWPVDLSGTQSDAKLRWLTNYLPSLAAQLPAYRGLPGMPRFFGSDASRRERGLDAEGATKRR